MTVHIGVIGCGAMGSDHVRTLITAVGGAEVTAVCDTDPGRAAEAARIAAGARVHADPLDVIGDPGVQAVLIASGDDSHEELVLACLAAGKPVLCEKPLATTPEACLRVVRAEVAGGRRLVQVGFMRRFDPSYREMRRVLAAGRIGAALMLHSVHRNAGYPPGYPPDALITGTAVHDIDIARWLLDAEIGSATVHTPRASSRAGAGFQDPRFLVLSTRDGVLVTVEVFVHAGYGYDVRGELVGESGTVTLQAPAAVLTRHDGFEGRAVPADFRPRFAEAYREELRAFTGAAATGAVCGATAWDGYAAAAVAAACLRSAGTGRTVAVELADPPALYRTRPA